MYHVIWQGRLSYTPPPPPPNTHTFKSFWRVTDNPTTPNWYWAVTKGPKYVINQHRRKSQQFLNLCLHNVIHELFRPGMHRTILVI